MGLSFNLDLVWSQVAFFDANLSDPFNDWTEHHLLQGFSWRPGSVSFKLPVRSGGLDITVDFVDSIYVKPDARWAIVVPFTSWAGVVEVSTMSQSEIIEIPSGRFALIYQTGVHNGRAWAHFGLLESPFLPIEPVVLKGDDVVHSDIELLMEAQPAA